MLEDYRKYNFSVIEVILENLCSIYDVKLESKKFNYIKNNTYKTDYIKYIVPGSNEIEKLLLILDHLKEESYLLLHLPLDEIKLDKSSMEDAFNKLLDSLNPEIASEVLENKKFYKEKMIHNEHDFLPLLFKNKDLLDRFFEKNGTEIENYFIGNVLLFPLSFNWFIHFDYDLEAIHFTYKNQLFELIKSIPILNSLTYSNDEINDLIIEANEWK